MLITSFYCVAGKQYFYAKICSQKRATLAMQQYDGTTGLRDHETTKKTQAFSGILRHSQSCVAARCILASEGRRVLHSAKMPSMGSTKAYVPLTAFFVRGRNRPLITPSSLLEADSRHNLCTLLSLPVLRLVEAKERRYDGRGELAY